MHRSIKINLLSFLLSAQFCMAANLGSSEPAPEIFLSGAAADTLIDSSLGKLRKIYALKNIIKDIPNGMIAGAAFDHQQRLYAATFGYGKFEAWTVSRKPIYRIETDGRVSVFAEVTCGLLGILGVDDSNSIYVTVSNEMNAPSGTDILKISEDGKVEPYSEGYFQPCSGVFDPAGNFYFVDAQQKKIYRITPQNIRSVIFDINASSLSTGLLFHGMAFDSTFSTCYLVGYAPGWGKVLKCTVSPDWKMGPLTSICDLPSPSFAWMDRKGVLYVTFGQNQIARILTDGTMRSYTGPLYGKMLDDSDRKMYIISPEDCQLYQIVDEDPVPADTESLDENLPPRIIEFSLEPDSLACGRYVAHARVQDESSCCVHLFMLHDGKCDSVRLELESSDSTLYRSAFENYTHGDSLSAWLSVVDAQGVATVSDTLGVRYLPYIESDLDSDGGVDVFDLLTMLKIISGSMQPSAGQRYSGDLDRDGRVSVLDLLALLNRMGSH